MRTDTSCPHPTFHRGACPPERTATELAREVAKWLVDAPGYPINVAFFDDDRKPIMPPKEVLDALSQAWRDWDAALPARLGVPPGDRPLGTLDDYRDMIEEEIGL